ncbi:MAG: DUF350 domain-containing protein [Methylococcales symbiont of Iophon sp. n. MRB-2018]|nr:MAG: DUF350 domain-containing protein [Methylococcales symbiont of Iophon sp. n. MRB-2018]KAF3978822.1 MAG: DUF350 domain-containing protein [Methylococcales symbiont of Iophon sp. n. MRB-2018]
MENLTQQIILSDAALTYYAIDFVILMGFMATLRILASSIAGISLSELLAKHDNFAAGIALAGAIVAVAVLMMGVVAGDAGTTYVEEITLMLSYGIAAMVFMSLTRIIFDKVGLRQVSIHDEIMKGNVAAGVVDAFNLIATAIIIRAAMSWVDGSTFLGLAVVLAIFLLSQIILLLATLYRSAVFNQRHKDIGKTLQGEIQDGNIALALRFSGYRLGLALAVTATSGVVIYDPDVLVFSVLAWVLMAVVIFISQTLLSIVLRYILLPKVNVAEEVGEQCNVAIGSIEAAIYIGVGFTFVGLFA